MIRSYQSDDLAEIMAIWLDTTISAHPFIDENYWREAKPLVENDYIPQSETWVYEDEQGIQGFISMLEFRLIGAIFIKKSAQHQGIGQQLIRYVQQRYPMLLLEVYTENQQAYRFYQKMGFNTIKEELNNETQANLATMCYQR